MATGGRASCLVIALDRWGRVLLGRSRGARPEPESSGRASNRRIAGQAGPLSEASGLRPVGGPGGLWRIPGGPVGPLEPPDECALRVFEEATGFLLERLALFRVFRPGPAGTEGEGTVLHVYYDDPDLTAAELDDGSGLEFRYFEPREAEDPRIVRLHQSIVGEFLASPAYRALFH